MIRTTPSRWTSLHFTQIFLTDARTFINLTDLLQNPAAGRIVFRELNLYPIARQQPDPISLSPVIPLRGPRSVRQNLLLICQRQPINQTGQFLDNGGLCPHLLLLPR
jgi:hypothetical protein